MIETSKLNSDDIIVITDKTGKVVLKRKIIK